MWFLYVVRCIDNSLYTGVAADVHKRLLLHNAGKGARYTRSRRPVTLVYTEPCIDKCAALRREAAIKQFSKGQKERLVRS